MKFLNYYNKFMYNRYGMDKLNKFLLKIYICVFLLDIFIDFKIFIYLKWFILLLFTFRFLSKNKFDRRKENRIFLEIINNKFKKKRNNNYIYKKCKKCNKKLRLPLPSNRGIKTVKCPNCKTKMKVLVLRKKYKSN